MRRTRYRLCACILMIGLLAACTGCGENGVQLLEQEQGTQQNKTIIFSAMEEQPVIEYVVPVQLPNILTDREGYQADALKKAALKGRLLPETFRLYDAQTNEMVWEGAVEPEDFLEEQKLYIAYADFTEFQQPGVYYIECDRIGRSHTFEIEEKHYERLYQALVEEMCERLRSGEAGCREALELLLACEWYPKAEGESSTALHYVAEWIEDMRGQAPPEDPVLYAAVLAKFSYLYQSCDIDFATDCLKLASTAYGQAQDDIRKDSENFLALAELYRATGLAAYGSKILDYRSFFEGNTRYLEEKNYLYGTMTYMMTRQKVDVELCDIFMECLRERSEEAAECLKDVTQPVTARRSGSADLLHRAAEVAAYDFVLNNYQYDLAVETYLHYLMGGNVETVDYYAQAKTAERAEYLLLLAQMADAHHKMES